MVDTKLILVFAYLCLTSYNCKANQHVIYILHYICAESSSYRMSAASNMNIKAVQLVNNPELEKKIDTKKYELTCEEILAFHRTAIKTSIGEVFVSSV